MKEVLGTMRSLAQQCYSPTPEDRNIGRQYRKKDDGGHHPASRGFTHWHLICTVWGDRSAVISTHRFAGDRQIWRVRQGSDVAISWVEFVVRNHSIR